MKNARTRLLARARRHLGSHIKSEAAVRSGIPFEEIVGAAKERKADMILMSPRGTTASEQTPFGSTAERVVPHASCPILVLPKPLLLNRRDK